MPHDVRVQSATPWEIGQVRSLIEAHAGGVYLEIGSYMGGSLATYGGAMPAGSVLIAVDRPKTPAIRANLEGVAAEMRDRYACELILGDSRAPATFERASACLADRKIDVLLVDGDHSVSGCTGDLDLYVPLVRKGGMVLMHDCGAPAAARPFSPVVREIVAGLHGVWQARSKGRRRIMIQEWAGYGGWWV
jgi:predicted O-methyltransferase YrrM